MSLTDLIPFRKHRRGGADLEPLRTADDPFEGLRREMNRLVEAFLPGLPTPGRQTDPFGGIDWNLTPTVDVKETRKDTRVTVELPGVDEKDLDVRLDGRLLTIRGEKRDERRLDDGDWIRGECCYGSFTRTIPLAHEVDSARVVATLKQGVLKLTLPKTRPGPDGAGRIEVKAG